MSDSCSNDSIDFIIAACGVQGFSTKDALEVLKSHGFTISERAFFNYKKRSKENIGKRARSTIESLFHNYLGRIETLKVIEKELWENYRNTKDVNLKIKILNSIRENQTYLSKFEEAVPIALDKQVAAFSKLPIGNKLDSKIYLEEKKEDIKKSIETADEPFKFFDPYDNSGKKPYYEKQLKKLESNDEIDRRELK